MEHKRRIINVFIIFLLPFIFGNTTGGCGLLEAIFSLILPPPISEPVNFNDAASYHSGGYVLVANRGNIFYTNSAFEPPESLYTVPGEPYLSSVIWLDYEGVGINIVVGDNGTIVRSTESNPQWTLIPSPVAYNLKKISYHCLEDAEHGGLFIVGDNGTILRSTDLGLTWNTFSSPTTQNLNDIYFPTTTLYDVSYTDQDNATIVGSSGLILRTTDGGLNWYIQQSGTTDYLYGVTFTDANTGTAVGEGGKIIRTTNGGQNWITQVSGTSNKLTDVFFMDTNIGIAVGDFGTILKTTNGGNNWVIQNSGTANELFGVYFTDTNNGTVVGYSYPGGLILRTTDGGQNWSVQNSGLNNTFDGTTFRGVHYTDENTGTIVGVKGYHAWSGCEIIRTTDGGQNWFSQYSSSMQFLKDVYFTSVNSGIAVGSWDLIMKTTNGGQNWFSQSPTGRPVSFNAISFSDANNGIAVGIMMDGGASIIIKTTDGGNNWITSQPIGCNEIIISGDNYVLFRTADGGQNWFPIGPGGLNKQSAGQFGYSKIFFYNDTLGFVAGPNGLILKTTNGGWQWSYSFAQGINQINDLYFISPDTGVAVGTNGQVRFTTDGGNNWFEETTVTDFIAGREVKRIFALSRNHGFIIGDGNLLIFTAKDSTYLDSIFTINSVEDENPIVTDFILYQNYPNPFNPTTIIKFRIADFGFVTLKIYDLLGREVTTLVNEEKYPGAYEITFDAGDMASGIYFYQLKIGGEFLETRKFVLLK